MSKIEWLRNPSTGAQGFSINPIKGLCPMDCKDNQGKSYCYARRMYKRFKWNPEIRFDENALDVVIKPGSKVFVGSTMELFGDWVKPEWMKFILKWTAIAYPWNTYIFLTKRPENLAKWSPFPDNCWVGVSVTNHEQWEEATKGLRKIEASVKFYSFEPLLHRIGLEFYDFDEGIGWIILGQQTPVKASTAPKLEWIREIVAAADKAKIPVFEKNNLQDLLQRPLRQEFPEE